MKIFITGATGYIGQRLMDTLIKNGSEVNALVRTVPTDPLIKHPKLKFFEGDLLDKISLKKAMAGCDQVYHLAAYARPWAKNPKTYFEVNFAKTKPTSGKQNSHFACYHAHIVTMPTL